MKVNQFKAVLLSIALTIFIGLNAKAQIAIGGLTPDTSAQLDIQSADRGFLLPRLTTQQRDSIIQPAEGLQVYNLSTHCLEINVGTGVDPIWLHIRCRGEIDSLYCDSATASKYLEVNQSAAGISITVPYTGGNGRSYAGQSINSTGVSGLTATLPQGSFAVGSGAVTLSLSGTVSQVGTASFALTLGGQSCTVEVTVLGGYPTGYVHCDPANPTVVQDVTNPTTGKTWMDRNLGASRVATAYNDSESYGDLFQWGRFADGHQCRNSPVTSTNATTAVPNAGNSWDGKFITEGSSPYDWLVPQNNNLWQGVNGVNNPCPNGYRLPTETELESERQSWSQNNRAGAFASPLRFPAAGYRNDDSGSLSSVGSLASYWSSSVSGFGARSLSFGSSLAFPVFSSRALGFSVRCLKD